jgi:hypothetical protein
MYCEATITSPCFHDQAILVQNWSLTGEVLDFFGNKKRPGHRFFSQNLGEDPSNLSHLAGSAMQRGQPGWSLAIPWEAHAVTIPLN